MYTWNLARCRYSRLPAGIENGSGAIRLVLCAGFDIGLACPDGNRESLGAHGVKIADDSGVRCIHLYLTPLTNRKLGSGRADESFVYHCLRHAVRTAAVSRSLLER